MFFMLETTYDRTRIEIGYKITLNILYHNILVL